MSDRLCTGLIDADQVSFQTLLRSNGKGMRLAS